MPEITLRITGLHELLGRDYGIEEHFWGPSRYDELTCIPSVWVSQLTDLGGF